MLKCTQMLVPFKYLGIKVGGNPRKREFWKEVVDKVKKDKRGADFIICYRGKLE